MNKFLRTQVLSALVFLSVVFLFFLPAFVFANSHNRDFADIVDIFLRLLGASVPLMAGLCLLAFFWGIAKFILAAGDEKKLAEGKRFMLWGVIALFVLVSLWGIVSVITYTLGFGIFLPLLPVKS